MITVSRLTVFPIKSLDGVDVDRAELLPSGALRQDRRYALQTADGRFVNGKRTDVVQRMRASFGPDASSVRLAFNDQQSDWFRLPQDAAAAAEWAGRAMSLACVVVEDRERGLPDDTQSPGPTLISTASLEAIAEWFHLSLEETRRRLRTNIEIDAPEPFWEDRLVGKRFHVGAIQFEATGVCQRCVVPARDSFTGEPTPGFQRLFAQQRESTLPATSPRERFNHFYRAALNTRLVGPRGTLQLGETLVVCG